MININNNCREVRKFTLESNSSLSNFFEKPLANQRRFAIQMDSESLYSSDEFNRRSVRLDEVFFTEMRQSESGWKFLNSPSENSVKYTVNTISYFERSGRGQLASFYAVYFVEQSFRLMAYDKVNKLLNDIDINDLTEWSMIALLRSSFSARSFLPAWTSFKDNIRNKLDEEGKNPKKLLRGLL